MGTDLFNIHCMWIEVKNLSGRREFSFYVPDVARNISDVASEEYHNFLKKNKKEIVKSHRALSSQVKALSAYISLLEVHKTWEKVNARLSKNRRLSKSSLDGKRVVTTYIIGDCEAFPFPVPPIAYAKVSNKLKNAEYSVFLLKHKSDIYALSNTKGKLCPLELQKKHLQNIKQYLP